jgi:hypothetical protein
MANLSLICAVAFVFVSGLALAGQNDHANPGSWSGVVINNTCSVDEAFAEPAKCTEKSVPGAKLALYDDNIRQICPPAASAIPTIQSFL